MKINASRLQSYFEAMSEIGKFGETELVVQHTQRWKNKVLKSRFPGYLILRGGLPVAVRYKSFMI
ncbi:MAG: hypothetical protein V4535_04355 [Bacteroidota bacterium]